MGRWAERFRAWRGRRRELPAEGQETAIEREAARVRRAFAATRDARSVKAPVLERLAADRLVPAGSA